MAELQGVTIGGYRSFASSNPERLRHLGKINLIAGQNNAGKSNVLRAIQRMADKDATGTASQPDRPVGDGEHRLATGYALNIDSIVQSTQLPDARAKALRAAFLGTPALDEDQLWFEFDGWLANSRPRNLSTTYLERVTRASSSENEREAMTLTGHFRTGSVMSGQAGISVLQGIQKKIQVELPSVHVIAGFREITHTDDEQYLNLHGGNLRRRLQRLQNPGLSAREDRLRFDAITRFVRSVLEDDSITIDVPHDLSTILVTQQGVTLPIESLGTGIHEVIILAVAATVVTESLICIEEPEIHLHPVLQRKLIHYLSAETNNQYFISTHSAHLLDSKLGSVHHVQKIDGRSTITYVGDPEAQSRICVDLGYRPSDLVQSNAVIWVEGPSDRLYMKHWLERRAPGEFIEGVHYSMMFYGGSMLNSLTTDDPVDVDEFISLRRLNRFMIVLMDSDRSSAHKRINANKKRVVQSLERTPHTGLAWVTAGYTIENYVPWDVLSAAIKATHPTSKKVVRAPQRYDNPLTKERIGVTPNKTRIAHKVIESWSDEWPMDLGSRVDSVIALIREANRTA